MNVNNIKHVFEGRFLMASVVAVRFAVAMKIHIYANI